MYCGIAKYVSFIFAVPCEMCPPVSQICATPSQPFWPYFPLHDLTLPETARQRLSSAPGSSTTFNTVEASQSLIAASRWESHVDVLASITRIVNGFDVRAQW